MHNAFPPELQRRLCALHRYVRAMEYGELNSLADLLHAAEQDAVLGHMFQEIDLYYQTQEQMLPGEQEQFAVEELVEQIFLQDDHSQEYENGWQPQPGAIAALSPLAQERRTATTMYSELRQSIAKQETHGLPHVKTREQKQPRPRSRRLLQVLAAALLCLTLLGGFLLIYDHPGSSTPGIASQPTASPRPQPSGLLFGITATTYFSTMSTTYTAYALRAANKTPIWSTTLSSMASPQFNPPVLLQKQVFYTVVGNVALALNSKNGQIIWKKVLPLSAGGQATLQIEGNLLVVGGQDAQYNALIYRLDEQSGALLWHHQLGPNLVYAVSQGVVYVGIDQVTSMYTQNPGSMRFLMALSGTNGAVIWQRDNVLVTGITVLNGVLYVQNMPADNLGNDKRYFFSAWTTGGTKLWQISLLLYRQPVLNSGLLIIPIVANVNSGAAELCAYRPENGQRAWCTSRSFTSYQVQDGVIYLEDTRSTGSPTVNNTAGKGTTTDHQQDYKEEIFLEAFDIQSQKLLWSRLISTSVVTVTIGGKVGQVTPTNPPQNLESSTLSLEATPLLIGKIIVFAGDTGIFTFSLTNGQPLWYVNVKIAPPQSGARASFVNLGYAER